jgi:hypothetical protein
LLRWLFWSRREVNILLARHTTSMIDARYLNACVAS